MSGKGLKIKPSNKKKTFVTSKGLKWMCNEILHKINTELQNLLKILLRADKKNFQR